MSAQFKSRIVGDATNPDDIARLMAGELADMVWTDPPYNVNYEGGTGAKTKIENDQMDSSAFLRFLVDSLSNAAAQTKPGGGVLRGAR